MRQQNNGRRRQNRGPSGLNRRSYSNSSGNINKNTVLDSSGPDTRQRGTASQLNEKYSTLASDATASDDRILAESFRQFADHYYRLNQEIELNNEARENKINAENKISENKISENKISENKISENNHNNDVNALEEDKTPNNRSPRRKRGFQAKEKELLASKTDDPIKQGENNEDKVLVEPQLDIN
jgi:hypothetical protein